MASNKKRSKPKKTPQRRSERSKRRSQKGAEHDAYMVGDSDNVTSNDKSNLSSSYVKLRTPSTSRALGRMMESTHNVLCLETPRGIPVDGENVSTPRCPSVEIQSGGSANPPASPSDEGVDLMTLISVSETVEKW